jgi:uncharacterized lipoprotein NlpE involved in copper resistance
MRHASVFVLFASTLTLWGCSSSSDGSGTSDAKDGGSHKDGTADAAPSDAGPPAMACDASSQCTQMGATTCCSGACVDLSRDPRNCGSCGTACSSSQFCTGTSCTGTAFSNICSTHSATVALDSIGADDEAGVELGNAVASTCMLGGNLVIASQDSGVIDPSSGRPLTGVGDMFVSGGGSYGQQAVGYMDTLGATPVYLHAELPPDGGAGMAWFTERSSGTNIVTTSTSDLTAHHDYFLLELSVEPMSGTLCFFGIGMYAPGTLAAAYYGSTQVLPHASSYTQAYYVYEWTDTNMNGMPDSGDTFDQLSGSD